MSRIKRQLTPVPPGYNGIDDECIRENATSRIIWHGLNAEALEMEKVKEYLAEGHMIAVKNCIRSIREIQRQLKLNGTKLLKQHYECARRFAEAERQDAERKERIAAADRLARGGR